MAGHLLVEANRVGGFRNEGLGRFKPLKTLRPIDELAGLGGSVALGLPLVLAAHVADAGFCTASGGGAGIALGEGVDGGGGAF